MALKLSTSAPVISDNFMDKSHVELVAALNSLHARVPLLEELAWENARTKKIQDALYRIAEVTGSAQNLPALYDAIHEIVAGLMPAKNFIIATYDEDRATISMPYFVDEIDKDISMTTPMPVAEFLPTLTGYVFRSGEALLADRARLLSLQSTGQVICRGPISESWLGVPFYFEGEVLGAIVMQSYDHEYAYCSDDRELLGFVSQQIAIAIVRKRQEQTLKRAYDALEEKVHDRTQELVSANRVLEQEVRIRKRAEELQAVLYRIAHLTNSSIQLDAFFSAIHDYVGKLITAKNFYIALVDQSTELVHFHYYVDQHVPTYTPKDFSLRDEVGHGGLTERVLRSGQPLLLTSDRADYQDLLKITRGIPPVSWLGIPLRRDQQSIGVLAVQSYSEHVRYTEQDRALLMFVGEHISAALQRKQDADLLKQAYAQLSVMNDELEKRIDARNRELNDTHRRLQDSLEQRQYIQDKLAYAARHDPLTGLPNRSLLVSRLEQAMQRAKKDSNKSYAILFLDLDRFKVVNDSLGHQVGDALLVEVGKRLVECVKASDTVARLGGDEFCILLLDIFSEAEAIQAAERILKSLTQAVQVGERSMFVSTSIGIALGASGYLETSTVLRDADTAMYQAKALGAGHYAVFDPQMYERVVSRLQLESELRSALQADAIDVAFQPIVDLASNQVISFEVLARWDHAELGAVSPAEFIQIAEEAGLIQQLGMQILEKAMRCMSTWRQRFAMSEDVYFCVNLSAAQFSQTDLLEVIVAKLNQYGLPSHCLRMEVTESLFIDNLSSSRDLLNRFNRASICTVLDDFGTGYSSLSYLHKLPFSALKIDRSFIHNLERNTDSETIVRIINSLAENMGVSVVAEGIETEAQLDVVRDIGVCHGQGYLFSKPLLASQAEPYLNTMFGLRETAA